jgi:hypothetical protein
MNARSGPAFVFAGKSKNSAIVTGMLLINSKALMMRQ